VVLRAGNIELVGSPLELYENPDNKFVAGFIGSPSMNFLQAVVVDGGVQIPALGDRVVPCKADDLPTIGTEVIAGLRPQELEMVTGEGPLEIDITEDLGGVAYSYLNAATGERLIVEVRGKHDIGENIAANLNFQPDALFLFDAKTERRIR